ncbi:MAG: UDP-N-acetylmuramate dehydrogenase [Prevotella sp.]|nr:UDP-N-acetylmuramate dehydrogenase [Prevotella sp.]
MVDIADYNLLPYNTFGISARCSRFVKIENEGEASDVLPSLNMSPLLILGRGSNLLLTKDFSGTVIRSAIRGIEPEEKGGEVMLHCASGELWDDVVAYAVGHDMFGAENLSLIPGDVGAAAVQNIGAYGAEIKDILHSVNAVDIMSGKRTEIAAGDCGYGYRTSRFKREWCGKYFITDITLRLSRRFAPNLAYGNIRQALLDKGISSPTAEQLRNLIIDIRRKKLPDTAVLGNAGSFFTNPITDRATAERLLETYPDLPAYDVDAGHVKLSAARMIELCGWKGKALGKAAVYERQPLVLINLGGATGADILRLCERIQDDVEKRFGIRLTPEVNIV